MPYKPAKLKKAKVIRYLRPTVFQNGIPVISNLGGVTFIFDLDYEQRTVSIKFSVCNEDENFDKKTGVEVAESFKTVRAFDLDKYRELANRHSGFVNAYLAFLDSGKNVMIEFEQREKHLIKYLEKEYSSLYYAIQANK